MASTYTNVKPVANCPSSVNLLSHECVNITGTDKIAAKKISTL